MKSHLVHVKPQRCGGNLAEGHVCALSHLGPHAAHVGALDCSRAMQFHPRRTAFGKAQAEAHVLEAASNADTVRDASRAALRCFK